MIGTAGVLAVAVDSGAAEAREEAPGITEVSIREIAAAQVIHFLLS